MAITYNAGTNTITVTGYTEGTPCTFLDIYNADVAGAWGKVSRQCTNQFCFICKLQIGDGLTASWFADEKQQIKWSNTITTANYQNVMLVKTNGHCRFGKLINDTKKITRNGCHHTYHVNAYRTSLIRSETGAELLIFCSSFVATVKTPYTFIPGADGTTKIYNTTVNSIFISGFSAINMYNVLIEYGEYGTYSISGTMNKITIHNTSVYGLIFYSTLSTLKNITYHAKIGGSTIRAGNVTGNCYLINPIIDSWDISWGGTGYPVIYRQYELDLKVIDKDNVAINAATVKIWDKNSNLIVDTTTNASGVIATQTISRGYYNQANGNTLQEYSPHLIKIEKAGYTTYEADFTLDAKKDWLTALQTGGGLLRNPSMGGGMV